MKKLLPLVFGVVSLAALAVPEYGMNIGTNSVKIAPERGSIQAVKWESGIEVGQGQIVDFGKLFYMAETGMVESTTIPIADANFRSLQNNKDRSSLIVCNVGAGTVWLNIGAPARTNFGMRIPTGWVVNFDEIQSAVYAISDSTGSRVIGVDIVGK